MTSSVHTCLDKALAVVGLGEITIRHVNMDEQRRLDICDLLKHISSDQQVKMVCIVYLLMFHYGPRAICYF